MIIVISAFAFNLKQSVNKTTNIYKSINLLVIWNNFKIKGNFLKYPHTLILQEYWLVYNRKNTQNVTPREVWINVQACDLISYVQSKLYHLIRLYHIIHVTLNLIAWCICYYKLTTTTTISIKISMI